MTAIHLAIRKGGLCGRGTVVTSDRDEVTCKWCLHRIEALTVIETEASAERVFERRHRDACRTLGIEHVWEELVAQGNDPSSRLARGVFGAVALSLVESRQDERLGGVA